MIYREDVLAEIARLSRLTPIRQGLWDLKGKTAEENVARRETMKKNFDQCNTDNKDPNTIASDLGHLTQDWTEAWPMIVTAEIWFLLSVRELVSFSERKYRGYEFYKLVSKSCDKKCSKIYNESDGRPRIFDSEFLIQNGLNYFRPKKYWIPSFFPSSVGCGCSLLLAPPCSVFNADGDLIPA